MCWLPAYPWARESDKCMFTGERCLLFPSRAVMPSLCCVQKHTPAVRDACLFCLCRASLSMHSADRLKYAHSEPPSSLAGRGSHRDHSTFSSGETAHSRHSRTRDGDCVDSVTSDVTSAGLFCPSLLCQSISSQFLPRPLSLCCFSSLSVIPSFVTNYKIKTITSFDRKETEKRRGKT